jgi:hypothetical protein
MDSSETPEAFLERWLAGINAGDVEQVAAMYDGDAVLLPTFSNHALATPAEILGYFVRLSSRDHMAVALHHKTVTRHELSAGQCCLSGIYRWTFDVDAEALTFEARFSFVIDMTRAAPILHHHSSQIPRML